MAFEIYQFAYNDDNYGVLIHDAQSGETACIDAGDDRAVLHALSQKGWTLTQLWITHHHWDHTDGLEELKAATGCTVYGPAYKGGAEIVGVDVEVSEADVIRFAGQDVQILHTPGHTTDMINFYLPSEGVVFMGDTLFPLGCGRLFEGTPAMMWDSLSKLAALPQDTLVYCGHEYTQANAEFAVTVDPKNESLINRSEVISKLRAEGRPTVPTTVALELATNPFLRASDPDIRAHLGMESASDAEVFTEIRKRKDHF